MKFSLPTTLLALTAMISMAVGSSTPRELQSDSNGNPSSGFVAPSIKISGVSTLLQILNSATAFTNSTFDIITIDSFFQSITDQGVLIQGKVTLTNDQAESVTGLLSGLWDPTNNKIVFNATKYEIDTDESDSEGETTIGSDNSTTIDDGDYTPTEVNPEELDSDVSTAFNWGVKALIETGERQNKIPISDYAVTEWISAAYKNQTDGVSYKFVAELLGANYVHVETNMTVVYSSSDQSYRLDGYYYKASNISEGSLPNNFTDVDNSTDVNNSTNVNNGTNSTNNTISTPAVPENYTYISPADLASNPLAQSSLAWGVGTLIQKAINQYKLPAASPQYNVTNLILAAYKNTSSGANYLFQTNLANALKYKVDANITVAYRTSNQTFKLSGYSFKSYNYPAGAIVIPPNNTNATNSTNNSTNNATNNNTSPSNTTTPDNSTVVNNSTGNATQPSTNSTTNSTNNNTTAPTNNSTNNSTGNTTSPNNSTNPTNNTTAPGNTTANSTTPVNQTTADGYTIMNSTQLANDSIAQVALKNGANALIQNGINQNKIPAANANYTINNVTFAGYKKGSIGTSYKFSVNMTNIDYVHVDANLTVFYRLSNKAYSLNGWSFRSYNYTSGSLNNGNNNTNSTIPPDMDPPIYDDGDGGDFPIIIEPDGSSGAR